MKKILHAFGSTFTISLLLLLAVWHILATNAYASANNIFVAVIDMPLVNPPSAAQNGQPNSSVMYDFVLTNTNMTTDTFFVTVETTSTFAAILTATGLVELEPSGSGSFSLTVDIPSNALGRQIETHVVVVTSTQVPTPTHVTATTTVNNVLLMPTINPPNTAGSGNPSEQVVYTFTVTNQSNITDTFDLAVTGLLTAEVVPSQLLLGANNWGNDTGWVTVTVDIPALSLAGAVNQNFVLITPTESMMPTPVVISTTTNEVFGVVVAPSRVLNVSVGQLATYTHTVTNTGNGQRSFDLELTHSSAISPALPVTPLTLAAGASQLITISYLVPDNARQGTQYTTTLESLLTVSPTVNSRATTTSTVELDAGVAASPALPQFVYPNQTITYTHYVTNTGNLTDTFNVTYVSTPTSTFTVEKSASQMIIGPEQSATLVISVTALSGVMNHAVNTTTVTITSQNDSGQSVSVVDTTTALLYIVYLPLIEKPLPLPQWRRVSTLEGKTLSVAVCQDDATINFAGTDQGLFVLQGSLYVPIGAPLPSGNQALVTNVVLNQDCTKVYVSIYNDGVWTATRPDSGTTWTDWSKLNQGVDVKLARGLVLANNNTTPVVGGDFGLAVLADNDNWQKVSGISGVVMDLSISAPVLNTGRLYAVVWLSNQVWTAEADSPTNWMPISGISNLPSGRVLAVTGNQDQSQIMVGTLDGHYRLSSNSWETVESIPAYSFWLNGNDSYVGYSEKQGVHVATGAGSFSAINGGWLSPAIPETVYQLVRYEHSGETWLYAATSAGVWRYGQE